MQQDFLVFISQDLVLVPRPSMARRCAPPPAPRARESCTRVRAARVSLECGDAFAADAAWPEEAGVLFCTTTCFTPELRAALSEAQELARHAGAGEKIGAWAQQLAELHAIACQAKPAIASRLAAVDGLHLSADLLHWEGSAHERLEQEQLRVYAGRGLEALPREWQGKRYRRMALASTVHARAEAETSERRRWARELAGLLVEVRLPFARSLEGKGEEDDLRCCRGLRAGTLEQRISCWRPFRRWLLTQGFGPWPRGAQDVIDYLGVRRAERAAKSAFSSLVGSLRFLEEAGEVPLADRLSQAPAVLNALREHTLATAEAAKRGELRTPAAKGQAPQLPLSLVVALATFSSQRQ